MNNATLAAALLCSASACVAAHSSSAMQFKGIARQYAEVTGKPGSRIIQIIANGDPSLGAGMQADCELRAREDSSHVWHLVPYQSELMDIDASDIEKTHFSLKWQTPKQFVVDTDFDLCALGLFFGGAYRSK